MASSSETAPASETTSIRAEGEARHNESLIARASRGEQQAIQALFRSFIPPDEPILLSRYLGRIGWSWMGKASFGCVTPARVATIKTGIFSEVNYSDIPVADIGSVNFRQPSKIGLYVSVFSFVVGIPGSFATFDSLITALIVALLLLIEAIFLPKHYYRFVKSGIVFKNRFDASGVYMFSDREHLDQARHFLELTSPQRRGAHMPAPDRLGQTPAALDELPRSIGLAAGSGGSTMPLPTSGRTAVLVMGSALLLAVAAVVALVVTRAWSADALRLGNISGLLEGSAEPVAASIQPGQWEMTARVTQMEMPGAPPEVQAQIAAQRNRQQTSRTCITPAQASNPLREFREAMVRGQQGANCQTAEDVFAGGVIRIRDVCRPAGGGPDVGQMAMEGSFTATTLQATLSINTEATGTAGPPSVRMSSAIRGRRIGECPYEPVVGNGSNGAKGG